MTTIRLPLALVITLVALLGTSGLSADPGPALTPPSATGVALDGRLDEAAWKSAARLPVAAIEVPTPDGKQQIAPDVRALSVDGRLVIGVQMAEDPGTSIGLRLMCAPEGTKSAGDAVSIDFRPLELRAPRIHVLGPKGVGRAHYRVDGAADWQRAGAWSLEAGVPWADLAAAKDQALRLAVVVYTRTPNVLGAWPEGAVWRGPARWNEVVPPPTGWLLDVQVDTQRIAREDKADAARMAAWLTFQKGAASPIHPRLPRAEVLEQFEARLVAPLHAILELRPDLEAPVRCVLGDAYQRLGLWQRAGDEFFAVVRTAPGWRAAQYGLHLGVLGRRAAEGEPGAPSDYAGAFARIADAAATRDPSRWQREGVRLGRALLQYKHGEFAASTPVLQELAKRYPADAFLESHAQFSVAGRRAAYEAANRAKREGQLVRPKAEITTTRGVFVIELFPDEAQNTVKNFVYLAQKKFYDGLAFHRTEPFFLVQTGDPNSREGAAAPGEVGTGTPGYAIRSERNKRRMLRGAVVMASAGKDSEGSQFYVLTGTAMHLQGEQAIFGRVLTGQDVVDGLRKGDRIVRITLSDLDAKARYVPLTAEGREPK